MVCVGNQCRSPLAERLLQARTGPGSHVAVSSAGTIGPSGIPMDAHAAAELARLGGTSDGFLSRRVTPQLLADQDLILAMTRDLRTEVLRMAPRLMRRSFTLAEFAGILSSNSISGSTPQETVLEAAAQRARAPHELDIRDPIGLSTNVHRTVANEIDAHVGVLAARLE